MSERIEVAEASELEPGDREFVTIDGQTVGVLNYEGDYFAIQNRCPHQYGSVCDGLTRGQLVADWRGVGDRKIENVDESSPCISCPRHGWEYDLKTGVHLGDPSISLDTYEVEVEDGVVYVHDRPAEAVEQSEAE